MSVQATIEILKQIGPILSAATPLVLGILAWWLNYQNKKAIQEQTTVINDHSTHTTNAVRNDLAAATGTHRILSEG